MANYANDLIVGYTGFVGSNLAANHEFRRKAHSSNICDVYGLRPDLCVYAGVPSAMFLANRNPKADLAIMQSARENIRRIQPRKVILISTIAVYDDSRLKTEASPIEGSKLAAYGRNRLQLEQWLREDYPDAIIVRLPALYGKGLKKNFVKDMIAIAPPLLRDDKYAELAATSPLVRGSYKDRGDGFHAIRETADAKKLREWFGASNYNALSFTDSRSRFQFYDLARLWTDILTALDGGWDTMNLATPPIPAAEIYQYIWGKEWRNELDSEPFDYDMRTVHDADLGGAGGYICSRADVLDGVKTFVEAQL